MKVYMPIEEHECYSEGTTEFRVIGSYATRAKAEEEADACRAALAECVGSDTKEWDDGNFYGIDDYYSWYISTRDLK